MAHTEQKKLVAENIWLGYFNRVLFEENMITEAQRNKLSLKIEGRKAPALKK